MAVPRNRTSNARKNSRRAHHAYHAKSLSGCPACGAQRLPHRACPSCGRYKDRIIVDKSDGSEG